MRDTHSRSTPRWRFAALVFLLAATTGLLQPPPRSAPLPVLILHDSSGPYGHIGPEYALMLRNLLGHFDADVTTMPASAYRAGAVEQHAATFYLGSTYDERSYLPAGSAGDLNYRRFLADVAASTKPVVWMNYNLWALAWHWNSTGGSATFEGRFGFDFVFNDLDHAYNRVLYKNVELHKGVVAHAAPGAVLTGCAPEPEATSEGPFLCSPEVGRIRIADPGKVTVYAEAFSTVTGARSPYIVRAANLWFVADMPFTFMSEEDRYLALADVLHDMLGVHHAEQRRALVRLEDVSSNTTLGELQSVVEVLAGQQVPYSVALIPFFEDPAGVTAKGTPKSMRLLGSPLAAFLQSEVARGGASIVQHGTTHQWSSAANPYSGVSGEDFEFYRVIGNPDGSLTFAGKLPEDSAATAQRIINRGRTEVEGSGLSAFAWEAPHYTSSPVAYTAIQQIYGRHYGRLVYYATQSDTRFFGQFFPYVIQKDAYGYQVVPENLHNVVPDPLPGYRPLMPADLVRHARKGLVVRDGFASFFYHPGLGPAYLDETVRGIKALGYTFVNAASVVN